MDCVTIDLVIIEVVPVRDGPRKKREFELVCRGFDVLELKVMVGSCSGVCFGEDIIGGN